MARTAKTEEYENLVRQFANGNTSSTEIARLTGLRPRHVRKILLRLELPRLHCGSRIGAANHQFETGRRVSTSGYVIVAAPPDHPHAKVLKGRKTGAIFEHRLVMEQHLGRYLLPTEIVDHVDGLTLHNSPENLRLFQSNAEHLKATLTGKVPNWSEQGYANMKLRHRPGVTLQLVDTYRQRKEAGVVRLHQILLAALTLGIDSPYLLGTTRHTTTAGIDMSSRSTIEHALDDLCSKWGLRRPPL